jgi:hypothetical protein
MLLGAPVQIAYAVDDLDAAARTWAQRSGAGPFFVVEHIAVKNVRYRGAPATFDHSSAYGQWGDVMVELVKDHTVGPSPVRDVVGEHGTGLHHLAYFVSDLVAESARLDAVGWPQALYAETNSGTAFVFHDATAELGHMIELYVASESLQGFYAMVAEAANGWDGRDPVRLLAR